MSLTSYSSSRTEAGNSIILSSPTASPAPAVDPNIWLEEVESDASLSWVRARNAQCVRALGDVRETAAFREVLGIMDSKEKIAYATKHGEWHYNLWKDATNKRGLWRRTTLAAYRAAATPDAVEWETVLDVDALCELEGESWVWHGPSFLDEGTGRFDRCLLSLSPGGSDASVHREFDVLTKAFIAPEDGGFVVPVAKSRVSWKSRDTLFVGTDFTGDGSTMTDSGYPRLAKEWTRGTPLADATLVFEAQQDDMSCSASRWVDRGTWYSYYRRQITFYTSEKHLAAGSSMDAALFPAKLAVPDSCDISTFGPNVLVELRDDWSPPGAPVAVFSAGSLVSIPAAELLASPPVYTHAAVLFAPTPTTSLSSFHGTKNYLVVQSLEDVRGRLVIWQWNNNASGTWSEEGEYAHADAPAALEEGAPPQEPGLTSVSLWGDDSDFTDDCWLTSSGFTTPTSLYYTSIPQLLAGGKSPAGSVVKSLPHQFDSARFRVTQHFATSADGTKIPYFQVAPWSMQLDSSNATLLWGYGGFEITYRPSYSASRGKAWLERGGVFVLASIRGGGEYGPAWHQAALKENRHKCCEDMEAVATHLLQRGVTRSSRLGIQGGSNGGLLMGNLLLRRPKLWSAVVCQVPLLDMQRYHKLLAGASWMGEYGNPELPEEWAYLQHNSPYQVLDKVKCSTNLPRILFVTSTRDDRVHPAHARKMCKKMIDRLPRVPRWSGDETERVVYYENIEGGHGAAADNTQAARMYCIATAFLWQTLGGAGGSGGGMSSL